ncbi:MAG: hypothetical protein GWP05_08850 [Anaerolineaceae bacterium]|nr:hypothetical protein [Anaerolineaceae bacterium]
MNRPHKHSFTLLEVMAAAAIMGIALVVLLGSQGAAINNTKRIIKQVRALAAAEAAMDEFLALPYFEADADLAVEGRQEVALPGYSDDSGNAPFKIIRILTEHVPFEEQETMDVFSDEEEEEELPAEETEEKKEEEEFDPGEFIAVRIEVRDAGTDKLLASLATWIPKPLTEQYKERQEQRQKQP